jgi:hypothetical protein
MSKEQLTDQAQAQTDQQGASTEKDDEYGLPPHLHGQVMRLGPGDADELGRLLTLFPMFSRGILSLASHHMGMAAVQRAIAIQQERASVRGTPGTFDKEDFRQTNEQADAADAAKRARREISPPGAFDKDEFRAANDRWDAADGTQRAHGQIAPPGDFDKDEFRAANDRWDAADGTQRAHGQIAPPGGFDKDEFRAENDRWDAQDAWVEGARKYNEAHTALVDEFNELTGYFCLYKTGSAGLDPKAVRRWQEANGLPADGKVGPQTLAEARKVHANAARVAPDLQ